MKEPTMSEAKNLCTDQTCTNAESSRPTEATAEMGPTAALTIDVVSDVIARGVSLASGGWRRLCHLWAT
jgi:hypothetical protein